MNFWVEDDNLLKMISMISNDYKIIMIFGIKSIILSKKNLTANLSILILFLKKKSYSDQATNFQDRKIPEAGSSYLS